MLNLNSSLWLEVSTKACLDCHSLVLFSSKSRLLLVQLTPVWLSEQKYYRVVHFDLTGHRSALRARECTSPTALRELCLC